MSGVAYHPRNSQTSELANTIVGMSSPTARRFSTGTTTKETCRQQSSAKYEVLIGKKAMIRNIQDPTPKLDIVSIHAERRPIDPRQNMPQMIKTRLAASAYCIADATVFHDDMKALGFWVYPEPKSGRSATRRPVARPVPSSLQSNSKQSQFRGTEIQVYPLKSQRVQRNSLGSRASLRGLQKG